MTLVYLKVTISARSDYQRAQAALQSNNLEEAITYFNRAIHWYSPGSKTITNSIHGLWQIGTQAEGNGDAEMALKAFRAIRSSLYSARSFYTPHSDWIEKCDDRISTLVAQEQTSRSPNKHKDFLAKKDEALTILKMKTEPDLFWSIVCEVGFIGWIGCAIAFILRVFTGERSFVPRRAIFWGILIVLFYSLWLAGMLRA